MNRGLEDVRAGRRHRPARAWRRWRAGRLGWLAQAIGVRAPGRPWLHGPRSRGGLDGARGGGGLGCAPPGGGGLGGWRGGGGLDGWWGGGGLDGWRGGGGLDGWRGGGGLGGSRHAWVSAHPLVAPALWPAVGEGAQDIGWAIVAHRPHMIARTNGKIPGKKSSEIAAELETVPAVVSISNRQGMP